MAEPPFFQERQTRWGMAPSAKLLDLPTTGAAVIRWTRAASSPFRMAALRSRHTIVSLNLKPMTAEAWLADRRIWTGPIDAYAVRIVPPDVERRWVTNDPFDLLHVMLPMRAFQAVARKDVRHCRLAFTDPLYGADDLVRQIGLQLVGAMADGGCYLPEFADGLTRALAAHLLESYEAGLQPDREPGLPPARLRRVQQLVQLRLGEDLTVSQMAEAACYSEYHFTRLFRASTGVTPHRYLLGQRIARARRLLARPQIGILAIALECGFKDASHFSRVFRREIGSSPSRYRDGLS